jgi:hypothetical protein
MFHDSAVRAKGSHSIHIEFFSKSFFVGRLTPKSFGWEPVLHEAGTDHCLTPEGDRQFCVCEECAGHVVKDSNRGLGETVLVMVTCASIVGFDAKLVEEFLGPGVLELGSKVRSKHLGVRM